MIIAKKENIYGIDVFTFNNTKRVPFQLTFQKSHCGRYIEVCLVNLLGSTNNLFCKGLRSAISSLCFEYMLDKKCLLYFDIEIKDKRGLLLFYKFVRWLSLEPYVIANLEITLYNGTHFVEFKMSLKDNYVNSIIVNN
jgi:hypothetical protein